MANEFSYAFTTTFLKGGVSQVFNSNQVNVTVAGSAIQRGVQNIGTVDETLDLGGVTANGFLAVHNLDATNFVTLGADGSSYPVKVKAGEWILLRWNGVAIHAIADTSAVNIEYLLIDN